MRRTVSDDCDCRASRWISSTSTPIGKHARVRPPRAVLDAAVGAQRGRPDHVGDGRAEALEILLRLEAHEVVGQQVADQFVVHGQRPQRLDVRERNVQEEPERLADAALPQVPPERDEVVVVHPNEIVVAQQRLQAIREQAIDALIGGVVRVRVVQRAHEVVEQRPQGAVAEPAIVGLVILERQVDRGERDVLPVHQRGRSGHAVHGLAAPAEPQAALRLHGGEDAHGESAGGGGALRHGDAVGDGDDPVHSASSQERLSRIAELMMPTRL
jgi:hypothetical protein